MGTLTVAQRSERMARIKSKNTQPELRVRKLAHAMGYRFRLHRHDLPGSPDLTFPSRGKVIFVHGCFWHAHANCKTANRPKSRRAYWDTKFKRNRDRDAADRRALSRLGWQSLVIWECETKKVPLLERRLAGFLGPPQGLLLSEGG